MDNRLLSIIREASLNSLQISTNRESRDFACEIGLRLDSLALKDLPGSELISLVKEISIDKIHFSGKEEPPELSTTIELKLDYPALKSFLKDKIVSFVREIAVDNIQFTSSKDRNELSAKLGLMLDNALLEKYLQNGIASLFSEISADSLQIATCGCEIDSSLIIAMNLSNLALKNAHKRGIQIEELALSLQGLVPGLDPAMMLKSSRIIIKKLLMRISQKWVNDELKHNRRAYEEMGLSDVEIVFLNKLMLLKGSYKKGVSFPFSVEIKTGVEENLFKVELAHFNLMEVLPIPQWLQNILLDFVKDKLKYDFIRMNKSTFYIDIISALHIPLDMRLKDFRIEKEYLIVEV